VLSGWSDSSELAHWLKSHEVDVPVSPELLAVLDGCEMWRARTGGAFDAAAGALIKLLRDDVNERNGQARDEMQTLLGDLRARRYTVNRERSTARRHTHHARSLDAIAKGYIVGRAAKRALAVRGVTEVLLNIGGDLQHHGTHAVSMGVSSPFEPAENIAPMAAVHLHVADIAAGSRCTDEKCRTSATRATASRWHTSAVLRCLRVTVEPRTHCPRPSA